MQMFFHVIPANRHDLEVTTNNESLPEHIIVIPASPDQVRGGIQESSLDTGLRRYDGWTFTGKAKVFQGFMDPGWSLPRTAIRGRGDGFIEFCKRLSRLQVSF